MKKCLLVFSLLLLPMLLFAQQKDVTKMEKFISKTGRIIKIIDHTLPDISTRHTVIESKIRTIEASGEKEHFYQIVKKDKYNDKVASIAEEDLTELIKALKTLKQSVVIDVQSKSDYLENKFVTEDGFQVGYYIGEKKYDTSEKETVWFIVLERFASDNTVFFNDIDTIENAFSTALEKIHTLK